MHDENLTQSSALNKPSSTRGSVITLLFYHGLLCMPIESQSEGIYWIVEKCVVQVPWNPCQKGSYKSQGVQQRDETKKTFPL